MQTKHPDNPETEKFTPPRHWVGPEELDAEYWSDAKTLERRAQEFHDKPIEVISLIDRLDKAGIARRDFLTIMGASMALASFSCARRPVHKIIPYVVKPEEITPGVPNFYASTDPETGYGLLVKTREGRPIKLEGNPDHPMNRGRLDARSQAAILDLYDVDRLSGPIQRNRVTGALEDANWPGTDATVIAKLKSARSVRLLSGELKSPSRQRLIRDFLSSFRNASHIQYEPLFSDEIAEANERCYGSAVTPRYRFGAADMVVSLGADFQGAWPNSVEYQQDVVSKRKLEGQKHSDAKMSRLVVFEPTLTVTGANADEHYPIRPGDELKIALALANQLIVKQKQTRFASDHAVVAALSGYSPDEVASDIGLVGGAEKLVALARELWAARGRGLVIAGGAQTKSKDALALQVAVNLLNSALENEGATVDGTSSPMESKASFAAFKKLIDEMRSGSVDVLLIYRSNPMFTAPRALLALQDAMKKVPFIVVIDDRDTETAKLADLVLPDHHFLENWGDASPRKGVYSLQQPTIAPIHETRAFEDSLLEWARGVGAKSGLIGKSSDWHSYLMANFKEMHFHEGRGGGDFQTLWENSLKVGVILSPNAANSKSSPRSFKSAAVSAIPKFSKSAPGLTLALYESIAMKDGRTANNAWLQELPDPISSVTWDNVVNVGPATAKRLGIAEHDVVEVRSDSVIAELPVHVQPGMHPDAVSIAVGYGRRAVGKVGDQAGVDVFPFVKLEGGRPVFAGIPVTLRKTGRYYKIASTQWHTVTENRPVINDVTLAEYRKNPAAEDATDPELRLEKVPSIWPVHEYKGHRWGMSIDLNSCTGCSACTIACMAENNIPVVGRDQVRVSRQMHWIRIDRYYAGSPENPEAVFQPMLCQHCENAPCETVCPVVATIHDDEGLNLQAYNRCVGTRYCQNNCPYKVRRFNFFDHWKQYEGTMNMVWNPDVTVRSRGIMEKCTMCIQRIQETKSRAKDEKRPYRDGELQTACQQTCPTNAIVVGDMNDPASAVSKLKRDPRTFRVLENLATKPVVSYMTRVRNVARTTKLKPAELDEHAEGST